MAICHKAENEDPETFVMRILAGNSSLHHGAFKLFDFDNCKISFATYEYNDIPIIMAISE